MKDHFKIVSVKGNSVRVTSGIVTFDVLVNNGRIVHPQGLFIFKENFNRLAVSCLIAYEESRAKEISYEVCK